MPHLFKVELEKTAESIGRHALLLGCPQHWTIQPYRLKPALKCTVWSQCTPIQDRQTNVMPVAQRFVLTSMPLKTSNPWQSLSTDC